MAERRYYKERQYSSTKRRRRGRRRRASLLATALTLFLALVLLIGGGLFYLSNRVLSRIEKVDRSEEVWVTPEEAKQKLAEMIGPEDAETGEGESVAKEDTLVPEEVVWTTPVESVKRPKVKNILLIGQDARPGETRARSDTMILCSLNEETREITLTSFMRDMFVPFPGDYLASRMNHAYAWGGMSMLDQLIEEDFGVTIDGNVEVNFNGFVQVMDLIAPLEIELKDYEVGYMNRHTQAGFTVGPNLMNGEQLLAYARMRHVGKADWERTERQRTVLVKAFEKVRKLSLKELTDLADAALPCLSTDLNNRDVLNLVYTVVTNRIVVGGTYRLPVEGTYSAEIIYGMDVLVPDLQANSEYLHRYIYGR